MAQHRGSRADWTGSGIWAWSPRPARRTPRHHWVPSGADGRDPRRGGEQSADLDRPNVLRRSASCSRSTGVRSAGEASQPSTSVTGRPCKTGSRPTVSPERSLRPWHSRTPSRSRGSPTRSRSFISRWSPSILPLARSNRGPLPCASHKNSPRLSMNLSLSSLTGSTWPYTSATAMALGDIPGRAGVGGTAVGPAPPTPLVTQPRSRSRATPRVLRSWWCGPRCGRRSGRRRARRRPR